MLRTIGRMLMVLSSGGELIGDTFEVGDGKLEHCLLERGDLSLQFMSFVY